jgi:hypothetical protein
MFLLTTSIASLAGAGQAPIMGLPEVSMIDYLLGPYHDLIVYGVLPLLFLLLAVVINLRKYNRFAKAVGGHYSFPGSMHLKARDIPCEIATGRVDRYPGSPFTSIVSRIEPSYRAKVRPINLTYSFDLLPSFHFKTDIELAGRAHRVAADDPEVEGLVARSMIRFAAKIYQLMGGVPTDLTLRIKPERTFWMRKLPSGSTVILGFVSSGLPEDPELAKQVIDAFGDLLEELSGSKAVRA